MTNCTFSGNLADEAGGGMANSFSSSPTVTNCTFSGNSTNDLGGGGGMSNSSSSSPTVTNCTFNGNSANTGGGMTNSSSSSPTVTNCTFTGNTAGDSGGGMRNTGGNPTVINCTFSGNSASVFGAGMYNSHESSPTVTNCTFSGNTAECGGGGMYNRSESSPTVTNCILWGDMPDAIFNDDPDFDNPTVSFSDVQGGLPVGTIDGGGNIDADPLFVAPGSGNLRLMPGSPCIDAGDNTAVPKGIDTDLDGNPRFVDDPDTDDTGFGDPPIVDMGAYEFQVMNCPWDVNGNGVVDHHDILEVVHNLGRCDDPDNCPWDVNGDGIVNGRDVAAVARHFGACP